jgi:hypothetical protein
MAASRLFFNPNCKGVNKKLKIRLRIKGRAIIKGILFWNNIINTLPKDIVIKIYRNVQTGPNSQEGGDQEGFVSCEYQLYVSICFYYIKKHLFVVGEMSFSWITL